jgi:hypothetical protein
MICYAKNLLQIINWQNKPQTTFNGLVVLKHSAPFPKGLE